jgi:hypothetical protein
MLFFAKIPEFWQYVEIVSQTPDNLTHLPDKTTNQNPHLCLLTVEILGRTEKGTGYFIGHQDNLSPGNRQPFWI